MSRQCATHRACPRRRPTERWSLSTLQLISYIAERTEPTESTAGIGVDEFFVDYKDWCRQTKVAPLQLKQFAREFDRLRASPELEGKIKKFGSRYFGIAFVGRSRSLASSVA